MFAARTRRAWLGWLVAAWALLGVALMPMSACVTGATCVGGYVTESGACEALCESDKCSPGNECVGNRCVLLCHDDTDCAYGSVCEPAQSDSGDAIALCGPSKRRVPFVDPNTNTPPGGYGWPCALGDTDCTCPYGDPGCTLTSLACPNGLECDPLACADCAPDPAICGDDPLCNAGRCGDGTACTFNTCALAECTGFRCEGAGPGDAGAYCTRDDCSADDQCPSGFYCGITRDPHDICGNTCTAGGTCSNDPTVPCTTDGGCQKGNNNFCGRTEEPCLDIAQANAAGSSHFEGAVCALRRTCLKRDECVRCDANADCGLGGAQVCGQHRDQNVCLRLCAKASDCRLDEFCISYVPASGGTGGTCGQSPTLDCELPEECPLVRDACVEVTPTSSTCASDDTRPCLTSADCGLVSDTCAARSVCVPAAGACDASDSVSKFCRHCVDDEDCGGVDKGGRWGCIEVSNGEFGCVDLTFDIDCTTDADCPLSPGGRHGECLDVEVAPSSGLFMKCYLPRCDPFDPDFPCTDPDRRDRYTCN